MTKYLAIHSYEETVANPYWYAGAGKHESKMIKATKTFVYPFETEEALCKFLAQNATAAIEVYEVARKLVPKIKFKTEVTFE